MIKNNKGFMLIEVIVTSTIIVTSMIGLYTAFNRIYKNYNVKSSYYSVDAVYATEAMFQDMLYNHDINNIINNIFFEGYFKYLIEDSKCNSTLLDDISVCSTLVEVYKIKNMILVEYDAEVIDSKVDAGFGFKESLSNETFKDYVDYVISYYDIKTNEEYNYLLLTEIYDGSDYYYANLRVR